MKGLGVGTLPETGDDGETPGIAAEAALGVSRAIDRESAAPSTALAGSPATNVGVGSVAGAAESPFAFGPSSSSGVGGISLMTWTVGTPST